MHPSKDRFPSLTRNLCSTFDERILSLSHLSPVSVSLSRSPAREALPLCSREAGAVRLLLSLPLPTSIPRAKLAMSPSTTATTVREEPAASMEPAPPSPAPSRVSTFDFGDGEDAKALPPVDGGRHAWQFVVASFMLECVSQTTRTVAPINPRVCADASVGSTVLRSQPRRTAG